MKFRTHNKKTKAAALIIAAILALVFTACPQKVKPKAEEPPAPPKHAITFSVEGTNGTLKAKAEGLPETEASPITIEQGKVITFKAEAKAGYRVKGWTLDGKPITEAGTNTEYKLKVSKPATVKVSFEAIPPTKYTVTLTQTEHGKVTASPEIPEDKKVDKDTVITFTAKADTGYKVGKWTVTGSVLETGTGADESESAKVKITADTTVSVSFELIPQAILTLSPDKLNIEVKAKTADDSAITVVGCKETTLASGTKTTLTATGTTVILKGKITELTCYNNKLTELNVQGLTSLQKLDCSNNKLPELNVQGLTSLQSLSCRRNQLTELNVQGLTALQYLECVGNKLSELNVQGLTALQKLYCIGNQLSVLNVQDCTALKKLECHINQLNVQAMTALLNALPAREASDNATAMLYTEETDEPEGNCKDYTQPEDLKKAFDDAKKRNWKLQKLSKSWDHVDI